MCNKRHAAVSVQDGGQPHRCCTRQRRRLWILHVNMQANQIVDNVSMAIRCLLSSACSMQRHRVWLQTSSLQGCAMRDEITVLKVSDAFDSMQEPLIRGASRSSAHAGTTNHLHVSCNRAGSSSEHRLRRPSACMLSARLVQNGLSETAGSLSELSCASQLHACVTCNNRCRTLHLAGGDLRARHDRLKCFENLTNAPPAVDRRSRRFGARVATSRC